MASNLARERAAQAWCQPETSGIEMDARLAEAFAAILDEVWTQPWLGNATTGQLLEELKVRAEIHGYANYKTVGGEFINTTPATEALKDRHDG